MFHRTANDPRVSSLSRLDLFSDCTQTELRQVGTLTTEMHVPAGKTLCTQGAVGAECFIILEGEVTVDRDGIKLATLGPGAIIGEMALLGAVRRTANVGSITPVRLLALNGAEFRTMLHASRSVAEKLETGASLRAGAWDCGMTRGHDRVRLGLRVAQSCTDRVLASAQSAAVS
jgi:CRP-like cAMP-binding protein